VVEETYTCNDDITELERQLDDVRRRQLELTIRADTERQQVSQPSVT